MFGSRLIRILAVASSLLLTEGRAEEQSDLARSLPKRVILDTDPSSDPDDVGCMAMLHTMASRGECEILAVINSIHHKEGSLSISAIDEFYRRPAIPVGDYKAYDHVDAPDDLYSHMLANEYPHRLMSHKDALDSVVLYREILASAEPKSITIVVIGTMHNLSALLESGPCKFSELNGKDLVEKSVLQVVTMGGNFIDGKGHDRTNWGGADALCEYTEWSCLNKERNEMCRFVIENCKAPFVASGWEVGCGNYHNAKRGNVMTGQELKQLEKDHIVRRSYEYHFSSRGGEEKIDRHSNDQCALLFAIRGAGQNFNAYLDGKIKLTAVGECSWTQAKNGRQGYIEKRRDKQLIADEIEELMLGARPEIDATAPTAPSNLVQEFSRGVQRLKWSAATDPDTGSWVVGYRVYANGKLLGTAYGTQFILGSDASAQSKLEVRSINASGLESESIRP